MNACLATVDPNHKAYWYYLNVTSVETHRFCPDAQAGLRCETHVTHLPLWLLWNHTLCSCTNMKKRGCSVRWATSVFGELPNITAWIRLELIRIREDLIWSPQRFADTPSSQKQLQCIFFSREQLSDERIFFFAFQEEPVSKQTAIKDFLLGVQPLIFLISVLYRWHTYNIVSKIVQMLFPVTETQTENASMNGCI